MLESIKAFFNDLRTQGFSFYKSLTRGRRMALVAAVSVVLVGLLGFAFWNPTARYEVGYANLSQEDRNAILSYFKKNNVADVKVEGEAVYFPEQKVHEYKMMLAQENLPNSGGVGMEKFDEQAFGLTDFDQRINYLRAKQGEMQRTIAKLDPVESARVHIVLPETNLFNEEKKHATASIWLRLKHGKTLSQRQIQGILHLVARAVEGLDPKNISVVDHDGNMLTKPEEEDGGFDKVTFAQKDYQKKTEADLESKIREILSRVVGQGKVIAKIQADIDFKKVETTISDVDPERSVPIAVQRSNSSTDGFGTNPTGVPGAKSNLPSEKEDAAKSAGGSSMGSKSENELMNYEVKKTLSHITEPQGAMKKMTVAVLVDGKTVDGTYSPRSPEDIEKITKLVKNATGFVEGRDSLTVESTQFEPDAVAVAEQTALSARKTSLLQTGLLSTFALAGILFLYFAIVRPYFRWLTFDPEKRSQEQFGVVEYELERSGEAAKRVQVQEEVPFEKLSPKEQILYLAKNDPKKTTEAIRQFLSPQHN